MTPGGGFPLTLELTRDEPAQAISRVVDQRRDVVALVFDTKLVAVVELHRERAAFVDAASGPVGVFDEHLHGANSIGEP